MAKLTACMEESERSSRALQSEVRSSSVYTSIVEGVLVDPVADLSWEAEKRRVALILFGAVHY